MTSLANSPAVDADRLPTNVLQSIVQALSGMKFGQVTVIVQDGRVIQIDRTERHRFTNAKEART